MRRLVMVLVLLSSGCIIIPIPTGGGSSDPPRTPRPIELSSECARTVNLFVGDEPGPGTPRTPFLSKAKTTIGRRPDGSATVWIFDESGATVGSAQLAPETRRAVLDASCTAITPR